MFQAERARVISLKRQKKRLAFELKEAKKAVRAGDSDVDIMALQSETKAKKLKDGKKDHSFAFEIAELL